MIFGTLPHSDKFGTKGGIEWTSSATHTTDDPLGAVLANAGKAAGAGLGNAHPKDLHTIGKSAAKAAEAAGIEVEPELNAQIEALKAHQTPEQAGVVSQQADAAGNSNAAYDLRTKLGAYRAGNDAALTTIAQASPGLGKVMASTTKPADFTSPGEQDSGLVNFGGFARELFGDRESATKAPPLSANANDPAFSGLNKRCKAAAQSVQSKIDAAKPGSQEVRYLVELKNALAQGEKNPAEAVRTVRALSGTE